MSRLAGLAQKIYCWIDQVIILGMLKRIYTFSGNGIRKRTTPDPDWKDRTLADFKEWLDCLDRNRDPVEGDMGEGDIGATPDLYTLLAEFIALKKQIQLQNREQSKNIRGLTDFNEFADQGRKVVELLEDKVNRITAMEEKLKADAMEEALQPFLDVRDPLYRGLTSAKNTGNVLFSGRKKLDRLIDGYDMALKKFDQALARLDTFPILTNEAAFDPETMMAVDTRKKEHTPAGMVVDEISGGFTRHGRVIRPARVMVSQ